MATGKSYPPGSPKSDQAKKEAKIKDSGSTLYSNAT